MSKQSARSFFDRLTKDIVFRRKLGSMPEPEDRNEYMAEEGFSFSIDEAKQVMSEMTDEQLVAAGAGECRTKNGEVPCGGPWNRQAMECSAINGGGSGCAP